MLKKKKTHPISPLSILVCLIFIGQIIYLYLRMFRLNGFVFSDEYTYQRMVNNTAISQDQFPDYFFILQTRLSKVFGPEVQYDVVRLLNLFAFICGNLAFWRIATRFIKSEYAFIFSFVANCFPVNTYVTFFMPESQYYAAFWLLMLTLIRFLEFRSLYRALFVGLAWSYISLIKPHAIFFFISFLLYQVHIFYKTKGRKYRHESLWLAILVSGLACRITFGLLIAGTKGVSLFGNTYSSILSNKVSLSKSSLLLHLMIHSLAGQMFALLTIYALPIFLIFQYISKSKETPFLLSVEYRFLAIVMICLFTMILVTATFSAEITLIDPSQSIQRIHQRYYDYFFPIFLILITYIWKANSKPEWTNPILRFCFVASVVVGGIYLKFDFAPNFIDSPDIASLMANKIIFVGFALLSIFAIVFVKEQKRMVLVFALLQLPLLIVQGGIFIQSNLQYFGRTMPNPYVESATYLQSRLPQNDLNHLEVVGRYQGNLDQIPFKLVNPNIVEAVPATSGKFSLNSIGKEIRWVLVFDGIQVDGNFMSMKRNQNFVLYKIY